MPFNLVYNEYFGIAAFMLAPTLVGVLAWVAERKKRGAASCFVSGYAFICLAIETAFILKYLDSIGIVL